jgi:hypothetical protein
MMKQIFLLFTFLLVFTISFSQQVEINGVRASEFRGVQAIENKGYFTFYVNEKIGKGMVEFMLEIYDLDLKLLKQTPIQITKHSTLIGGEFNGNDFLFGFADILKKTNTMVTIDVTGTIIKQEVVKNKKYATAGTMAIYPDMEGDGFFITSSVKEKKWGYSIQKVDRNLSTIWEKTVSNDRGIVAIEATESGNGKLVVITTERPTLMSQKVTAKIVEFNAKTGDKQYEYSLYDGKITGVPSAFLIDKDGSVVTAGMYFDGEKWDNVNSDGIFFLKLSSTGEKEFYTTIDWENGIQKALQSSHRKFAIGSKPKVLFHDIVRTDQGYQVVSETFRKTVKAGTVLAVMNGNRAEDIPVGFTVMDFIIFNYDYAGKPIDINKIDKPYKSITVPGIYAQAGGVKMAYYMKKMRMFTYEFNAKLPGSNENVIVYSNWEEPKGLGYGTPYVGITSIKIGEESKTNKIPLEKRISKYRDYNGNSDNDKTGAIKSKPGYVCIYYYNKKEKTISMVLEELKLN